MRLYRDSKENELEIFPAECNKDIREFAVGTLWLTWRTYDQLIPFDRRYELDSELPNEEEILLKLPVYVYYHSSVHISLDDPSKTIDPGGWDSWKAGYYIITKEDVKHLSHPFETYRFEEVIKEELETLNDHINGYVLEGVLTNKHNEVLGYFESSGGYDEILSEASKATGTDDWKELV
jgi:hypothetical protein